MSLTVFHLSAIVSILSSHFKLHNSPLSLLQVTCLSQFGLTYQRSLSMFQALHSSTLWVFRYWIVGKLPPLQKCYFLEAEMGCSGQVLEPGLQLDIEDSQTSIKDFVLCSDFFIPYTVTSCTSSHASGLLQSTNSVQEDYDRILEAVSGRALDCSASKLTGSCYLDILMCLKLGCFDHFVFCMLFFPTK